MYEELAKFLSAHMVVDVNSFGYGAIVPGPPSLLKGLVNLYNGKPFNSIVPVKPEHIYIQAGASAILDQIHWTLGDEGDGVLLGKPFYGGFINDMTGRSKLTPVIVSLKGLDPFSVEAVARYEEELIKSEKNGVKVRLLILCTPHNPLGQ